MDDTVLSINSNFYGTHARAEKCTPLLHLQTLIVDSEVPKTYYFSPRKGMLTINSNEVYLCFKG